MSRATHFSPPPLLPAQFPPTSGARSSSTIDPWPNRRRDVPNAALTIHSSESSAKASADQWMNALERWCAKIAKSDQAMAIEAGRSPSGLEKA